MLNSLQPEASGIFLTRHTVHLTGKAITNTAVIYFFDKFVGFDRGNCSCFSFLFIYRINLHLSTYPFMKIASCEICVHLSRKSKSKGNVICFSPLSDNKKLNLYTRDITPKRVMSGGAYSCDFALGQHRNVAAVASRGQQCPI